MLKSLRKTLKINKKCFHLENFIKMIHSVLHRWHSENVFIENKVCETQLTTTIKCLSRMSEGQAY